MACSFPHLNYQVIPIPLYSLESTWDFPRLPLNGSDAIRSFNPAIPCLSEATCSTSHSSDYYSHLKRALFSFTRGHQPWVLKDPRLCITLKTWKKLLIDRSDVFPTILFTYRNPLEVALSLKRRKINQVAALSHGLRLWIWYNHMAIMNSHEFCRVVTR